MDRSVAPRALPPCPQPVSVSACRIPSRPHGLRRAVQHGPPASRVAAKEAPLDAAQELPACPSEPCREALFGRVEDRQVQEVNANVKGTIPNWLEGILFMNGTSYTQEMVHMFDGFSVIQKWHIGDGRVRSSHKFLETVAYKAYRESGKLAFSEFAAQPAGDGIGFTLRKFWAFLAGTLFNSQTFTDNAAVNIISVGHGKMLASSETKYSQYIVEPSTLELEYLPFADSKVKGKIATAHHSKLSNGDLINIGTEIGEGYVIQRINQETMECAAVRSLPALRPFTPSWTHDFPATDDYVVVVEQPLYFNIGALVSGNLTKHVVFDWVPKDGSRFHIVPLDVSKEVRTFSTPTYFAFHYGNAFVSEDGKRLCFDVSRYDDPEIINDLSLDRLRGGVNEISTSSLWRYELPLEGPDGGEIIGRCLTPNLTFCEFVSFNKEYTGKTNRFSYGVTAIRPTCIGNALCKVDAETGSSTIWHEPGCFTGEPHLIPRPSADSEDDGIVLASVSGSNGLSFLLFLDAKTFKEVARAELPYSMTNRLHGEFVPA